MKILLVAVNAKYIHSNLAVYSLRAYNKERKNRIDIAEYTINNQMEDIMKSIYKKQPDVIVFSCYIWNIDIIEKTARELKKLLPHVPIWFGGPEVSYNPVEQLEKKPYLDGIMVGEGEETFYQITNFYIGREENSKERINLSHIKGIVYRQGGEIYENEKRTPMDISDIPFPYEDIKDMEHKIIYYESSRGCPYSCSYCLSSVEKGIRFRHIELVKKELQYFIDCKVPQVKFIDRTFNCNHEHAMAIWNYIYEHDNGITNFHFEISADLLKKEELILIKSFRKGLIQLEIGVQSIHPDTIKAIHRNMDLDKLSYAVNEVKKGENIHQHLDLIAGLPFEDYETFQKSFNYVYELNPDQLQLGFLKVLKGSCMMEEKEEYGIVYQSQAPYEVLFTKWLPYSKTLELKKVEEMVEVYYNSNQFTMILPYLLHFFQKPFELYKSLGDYYEREQLDMVSHSRIKRYEILLDFCKKEEIGDLDIVKELLIYDLYIRENMKSRPAFALDNEEDKEWIQGLYKQEELLHSLIPEYSQYNHKQISRMTHTEAFTIDLEEAVKNGKKRIKKHYILFSYLNRNPLNNQGKAVIVRKEMNGKENNKARKREN